MAHYVQAVVAALLLYDAGCRAWSAGGLQKLQRLFDVRWRHKWIKARVGRDGYRHRTAELGVNMAGIRAEFGVRCVTSLVEECVLRWIGHVWRMPDS